MYTEMIVAVSIKPWHVESGDAENSPVVFSTCGDDCISAAAENAFCNPADNLKCLCQNLEAQNDALSCLNRQCSFKDMDTFDEAMAHCLDPDPKGTYSTTARTTLLPTSSVGPIASHTTQPTTTTSQPASPITSSPSLPPSTTSDESGYPGGITTPLPSGSESFSSPTPLPRNATESGPPITSAPSISSCPSSPVPWSNSTFTDSTLEASYVSSIDSLTSASSSVSSPSAHSPTSTAIRKTHGPSRTAIISQSTTLGFLFLIGLLVLVLYLLRRRRRRRPHHTKAFEPFPHPIHSAVADEARPSPSNEYKWVDADSGGASIQHEHPWRANASDASLLVISAPVDSRGAHELASPASRLFPHRGSAFAQGASRLQTGQSVSLSPTGENLGVAANVSIDTAAGMHDASRDTRDTGTVDIRSTAFPNPTEDTAKAHVDDSVAHRPSPSQGVDISEIHGPTSRPAAPSSHPTAPASYSLAPALEPSGAAALPSAVSLALRQRFLTVLMDLSEEDAEGRHPPPYYPRVPNEASAVHAPRGEAGGGKRAPPLRLPALSAP